MSYKIEIDADWLQQRAENEQINILSKKLNSLQYFFTSSEKIRKNEEEALKSLAIIEFISEIFKSNVENGKES